MKKPTIEEKILSAMSGMEGIVLKRHEIIEKVLSMYPGTNKDSVLPSDYCYNIINNGISFDKESRLFERVERAQYKYLGPDFPYNGTVYWKESEYGQWKNGEFKKLL